MHVFDVSAESAYEMKFFISVFGTFDNGDFEFDNKNVKV
jgi:hypothetical protein